MPGRCASASGPAGAGHGRARANSLLAEVAPALTGALGPLIARLRGLFDLDAHPRLIAEGLGADPSSLTLVTRRPACVPGAFDGFESAVRPILASRSRCAPRPR